MTCIKNFHFQSGQEVSVFQKIIKLYDNDSMKSIGMNLVKNFEEIFLKTRNEIEVRIPTSYRL